MGWTHKKIFQFVLMYEIHIHVTYNNNKKCLNWFNSLSLCKACHSMSSASKLIQINIIIILKQNIIITQYFLMVSCLIKKWLMSEFNPCVFLFLTKFPSFSVFFSIGITSTSSPSKWIITVVVSSGLRESLSEIPEPSNYGSGTYSYGC